MTAERIIIAALGAALALVIAYRIGRDLGWKDGREVGDARGYQRGYEIGVQSGKNMQWVDDVIAAGKAKEARERARKRNRWGNFAEKC